METKIVAPPPLPEYVLQSSDVKDPQSDIEDTELPNLVFAE